MGIVITEQFRFHNDFSKELYVCIIMMRNENGKHDPFSFS